MALFRVSITTVFAVSAEGPASPPRISVYEVDADTAQQAQVIALDYESEARRHFDDESASLQVEVRPLEA